MLPFGTFDLEMFEKDGFSFSERLYFKVDFNYEDDLFSLSKDVRLSYFDAYFVFSGDLEPETLPFLNFSLSFQKLSFS